MPKQKNTAPRFLGAVLVGDEALAVLGARNFCAVLLKTRSNMVVIFFDITIFFKGMNNHIFNETADYFVR